MRRLRVALAALPGLFACGPSKPDAVLLVRTPVPSQLYIDDRFVGTPARHAFGLRAGPHRIEVRAEGMLPAYREVTVRRGDRVALDVPLRPDLDRDEVALPPDPTPVR